MKPLLSCILMLLLGTALLANEVKERPKPPLEKVLPLLKPLEKDAIRMGEGPVNVYVFVDPFCPRSREFVSFLHESDKMRSRYSYYFFLYRLERFESQGYINAIYSATDPKAAMIAIMVGKEEMTADSLDAKHLEKVERIAAVARSIDVYKRPYLVMVKPPKSKKPGAH